jgi:hypothetical protein
MTDLNLSHIHLGSSNIFRAERKADALRVARKCGLPSTSIRRAYNRVWLFWVIETPNGLLTKGA